MLPNPLLSYEQFFGFGFKGLSKFEVIYSITLATSIRITKVSDILQSSITSGNLTNLLTKVGFNGLTANSLPLVVDVTPSNVNSFSPSATPSFSPSATPSRSEISNTNVQMSLDNGIVALIVIIILSLSCITGGLVYYFRCRNIPSQTGNNTEPEGEGVTLGNIEVDVDNRRNHQDYAVPTTVVRMVNTVAWGVDHDPPGPRDDRDILRVEALREVDKGYVDEGYLNPPVLLPPTAPPVPVEGMDRMAVEEEEEEDGNQLPLSIVSYVLYNICIPSSSWIRWGRFTV